ncbi:glycosyltransferase family 2 protein [Halodesulfovibrio spirochaetisodalis]|uniref:Glycosyltransferase 2-like domain-containing protein n=1 Tax=Halodesulfovibrio spirochaetisodalis TaxID=1560234 RepID=A0A1B7XI24_9BACT|nr:glycosyltransferase family 2 protein [Halodesulfovibrio spirochaetisodalis]OBQ55180.1 hypothetical protein SP90_04200 [Halodesulfovibrio spirochaetisodalis]
MLNNVTIIVKAFERPDSLVALYQSIRKYYPKIPIVIVDDGKKPAPQHIFDVRTKYVRTEYNIGASAGRNLALSHVETTYIVLVDDDFVFTEKTKLERMLDVLETTNIDIVSGVMYDFGKIRRRFAGCFDVVNGVFTLRPGETFGESAGHKLYHIVLNFFMARTETIRSVQWDPELKTGEHKEFFIRTKKQGITCTVLDDVSIYHYPEQHGDYVAFRSAAREFEELAFKKHGIHKERIIEPVSVRSVCNGVKNFLRKSSLLVSFVHFVKRRLA